MNPMPGLRRRVVEPIWARFSGSRMLAAWRRFEESQWLPEEALRQRQWQALTEIVAFAYRNNDFYRDRFDQSGVSPASVRDERDLAALPVLTKHEVRCHGLGLVSRGFDAARLIRAKTGGSTGKALDLYFTEEVSELRNACGRRHKRWSGWEVGEPVAAIWGNPVYARSFKERAREWLLAPIMYLDTMSVTPEAVERFAQQWLKVRPTLIFGHSHSIFVLARMVRQMNIQRVRPKAIISSSMMLPPHERAEIESVFGVNVLDMYGCEEVGLIASECERHEGLHVNVEQLFVEVLRPNGVPAAPGEQGRIVVTDLQNQAMPLIRYSMEDMAELGDRPCSCGRGLPVIRKVVGRVADFLRRRDGGQVAGVSLIENSLTRIPGIDQMQIVQDTIDHLLLRVVPGQSFTTERRDELLGYFATVFPGAVVEIEEVSEIKPEPNGKYRFSICEVPD